MNTHFTTFFRHALICTALICFSSIAKTNDTLIIENPCPIGGRAFDNISSEFDATAYLTSIPIFSNGVCNSSSSTYLVNYYWIRWADKEDISISISDSTLILSIYDARVFNKDEPCNGVIKSSHRDKILTLSKDVYTEYIVISIAGSLNQNFAIFPDKIMYVYHASCIFEGEEMGELLGKDRKVPPYIEVIAPDDNFIVDNIHYGSCNAFDKVIRHQYYTQHSTGKDTIIGSEYLFRKSIIQNIDFPVDVTVDATGQCGGFIGEPDKMYDIISTSLGDSLAQRSIFPLINGKTTFGHNFNNATFLYQDFESKVCESSLTSSLLREWTYSNHCIGETESHIQKITLKYPKPVLSQIADDTLFIDPWSCVATFRVSDDVVSTSCDIDFKLHLLVDGLTIPCIHDDAGWFNCAGFTQGNQTVRYYAEDCAGIYSDTLQFNLQVHFPTINVTNGPLETVVLTEQNTTIDSVTVVEKLHFLYAPISHCVEHRIDYHEIINQCDSLDDQKIELCCSNLISPSGLPLLQNEVKVLNTTVWRDSNRDSIFQPDFDVYLQRLDYVIVKDAIHSVNCPNDTTLQCLTADISPDLISKAYLSGTCFNHKMENFNDFYRDTIGNKVEILRRITESPSNSQYQCIQKIFLEDCISSSEIETLSEPQIRIYPNPFSLSTNLYITQTKSQKLNLTIFDAVGGILLEKCFPVAEGQNIIPLDFRQNVTYGVLFCQITSEGRTSTIKVLHQ
ncbi:MAG: T9SS type A sorting domain-containing protein [Saprospiraceae bacterium]